MPCVLTCSLCRCHSGLLSDVSMGHLRPYKLRRAETACLQHQSEQSQLTDEPDDIRKSSQTCLLDSKMVAKLEKPRFI